MGNFYPKPAEAPLTPLVSMSSNPYLPPSISSSEPAEAELAASANNQPQYSERDAVSEIAIEHLKKSRLWVKFCSLAGYITAGFITLIGLLALRSMVHQSPTQHCFLLGAFHVVLAALFIIPSLYLSRYEKSITHLIVSEHNDDLEQALAHQRAFWRQMAIIILIVILIYLATIAFSVIILLSRSN